MKLRDYQERAVEAIIETWKKCRSYLIVLPTGCGKTVVFGEVSPADGKALLDEYFKRIQYGLATPKQMRVLLKHGIQAPMSFQEASWTIDKMKKYAR